MSQEVPQPPGALGDKAIEKLVDYKPSRLPEIEQVEMVRKYVDSRGQPRICGGADLKKSQSYPLPNHDSNLVLFYFGAPFSLQGNLMVPGAV